MKTKDKSLKTKDEHVEDNAPQKTNRVGESEEVFSSQPSVFIRQL